MGTPVSRRTLSRSRVKATSTPTLSGGRSRPNSSLLGKSYLQTGTDEEVDDVWPSSQVYRPSTKGGSEVYWNYEASPSTKEELRRRMREADPDDTGSPVVPISTPPSRVRSFRRLRKTIPSFQIPTDPTDDEEAFQLFNAMKELSKKMMYPETMTTNSPLETDNDSPGTRDLFSGSDDDSFLVMCTQVAETKNACSKEIRITPPASFSSSTIPSSDSLDSNCNKKVEEERMKLSATKPSASSNAAAEVEEIFDSDGEMDALLSQMEMPTAVVLQPHPSARNINTLSIVVSEGKSMAPHQPLVVSAPKCHPPSTVPNSSQNSYHSSSKEEALENRNKKSGADVGRRSNSSSSNTTFRRFHSSPGTTTTSRPSLPGGRSLQNIVKPKCSREEIDRKRQEALKRLKMKKQQQQIKH